MSCRGDSLFDQKKQALYNINLWKSNFVNIWLKYGTTVEIDGVECFDYYRIDGDGDGQKRMSKHLKQPDLWSEVQDDDLEWVHLVFNLKKLIGITEEKVAEWITYMQESLEDYTFDNLKITITGGKLTEYGIYDGDDRLDDEHMDTLALLLGMYQLLHEKHNEYSYDEDIDEDDLSDMIPPLAAYGAGVVFEFGMVRDYIAGWLLADGVGVESLDGLVTDGLLIKTGNPGNIAYHLSVSGAKRMNGYAFVKLVTETMDMDTKLTWWGWIKSIASLAIAGIAAYFGFYNIALNLVVSWTAQKLDMGWISDLFAIYSLIGGDLSAIANLSVGESVQLLSHVYSVYAELAYKSDTGTEDVVDDDQYLIYKAPYEAYSGLYCYKPLISVRNEAIPGGRYR